MTLKLISPNIKADRINRIIEQSEIIKKQLEREILGRKLPSWKCNCGEHGCDEAKAIGIYYPSTRQEKIPSSILWNVKMRSLNNKSDNPMDYDYSTGLRSFIDDEIMDQLFEGLRT